jgi:hypothetical protein
MKNNLQSVLFFLFTLFLFGSCSNNNSIHGNWSAISSQGDYSELYITNNKIRIFTEVGGIIPSQSYETSDDSLKTNILSYKINWIKSDSLILNTGTFHLNLKRIKEGFKLSDYTNKSQEEKYKDDFYKRMYNAKGKEPKSMKSTSNMYQEINEETIIINRK